METQCNSTCKITLSNLIIDNRVQVEDVEATVSFIFIQGQKEIIREWENSQEYIPDSIDICSVIPSEFITMEDNEGCHTYIPRKNNMLYLLTDEQIEDIISLVYEEMK